MWRQSGEHGLDFSKVEVFGSTELERSSRWQTGIRI